MGPANPIGSQAACLEQGAPQGLAGSRPSKAYLALAPVWTSGVASR